MDAISPRLAKAVEIATAYVQLEVSKRSRLNPNGFNPSEVWASVTYDGRIAIGNPLLRGGDGFYVNHLGKWHAV